MDMNRIKFCYSFNRKLGALSSLSGRLGDEIVCTVLLDLCILAESVWFPVPRVIGALAVQVSCWTYGMAVLVIFAKLRKETASSCLSIRPHGTARLRLDGFS